MKTIAIMQPYFCPYIGYFQLMAACDTFVLHDDAQYIKEGWVNRNRILVHGEPRWITLPVIKAAHTFAINRRWYLLGSLTRRRLLLKVEDAYQRAPYFRRIFPLLAHIMSFENTNVAAFNANALREIALTLGIGTRIVISSEIAKDPDKRGVQRVIEICTRLGATKYRNPIGGTTLYDPIHFSASGLALDFLKSEARRYPQFGIEHVPSLSIIDALMFNDEDTVQEMLREFSVLNMDVGLSVR